jgi:UDP:flavonoid glycosyltransferase YjiC (YdhE family)
MPTAMGLFPNRPPEVDAWVSGPLAALWRDSGLPEVSDEERRALVFSPHLQVAFTTPAIVGDLDLPDHVVMVGPALTPRTGEPAFDVGWFDPARPHLLVTIGTLTFDGGADFLHRMATGLEPLGDRLQAVVLAPPGTLPEQPAHVRVEARTDVLALMPHLDGVVSHGGLNTVMEALWHGLPLMIAPAMLDHPMIADQVTRAGAGLRVDFDRATPDELRAAVVALLDGAHLRRGAEAVAESFRTAGGAPVAAARLARLAARTP